MTTDKPIESRALVLLCEARDVKRKELAALLGMKPKTLYEYMDGTRTPPRWLLDEAAAALDFPPHHVDRTLAYLRRSDASSLSAGIDAAAADREMASIAASLGLEWEELYFGLLRRGRIQILAFVQRQAAPVLWARLRAHPAEARPAVVREVEDFHSFALAELVCHESIEAASDDADEAVELAELACVIAEHVPETEPLQVRTQGYAHFHLGNALRVKGNNLPDADQAFQRANELWKAGAKGDPEGLLNEARVLGMEASLRRAQRLLPEALEKVDRALAADRGDLGVYLLINRAKILEEMDDLQEAVATLRRVLPRIDADREPRLFWNVHFNLLVSLCQLGQYNEAERVQSEVRDLALRLGKRLILARMDWLQGWIHRGLGRHAEAEGAFERARKEFLAQGIAVDAALVSLELAVVYLEQQRTSEVKTLARELAPIFKAQNVKREGFATVALFQEAAEQETITLELARRLLEDLRKQQTQRGETEDPSRSRRNRIRPGDGRQRKT